MNNVKSCDHSINDSVKLIDLWKESNPKNKNKIYEKSTILRVTDSFLLVNIKYSDIINCVIDKYKYCGAIMSIDKKLGTNGIKPRVDTKNIIKYVFKFFIKKAPQ